MPIEPFTLTGRHVELVPLDTADVDDLASVAIENRSTYDYTDVPSSPAAMSGYVSRMLTARDAGLVVPFAQRRRADGRFVGCTRFMELRWWRAREAPDEVEIGGTWLAATAQRTPLNTEAKLLLLTHAFDVWGVDRVALCTDVRNERSRAAIERIGARFEGVLRHHRPSLVGGEEGRARDSALFAITDDDWPEARDRLTRRLE